MTEDIRSALPLPNTRMTVADFLALPETQIHIELINGIVVYPHDDTGANPNMSPSPHYDHQRAVRQAFKIIDATNKGETLFAPMDLILPDESIIQPDVIWIAEDNDRIHRDKRLHGVPDLVVEVLSPSTRAHDKIDKFRLYEKAGISEYWMVDPIGQFVEICFLITGEYHRKDYKTGETFTSTVLKTSITVADFFA